MKRLITLVLLAAAATLAGANAGCDDSSNQVPQAVLDQASKPPENTFKAPTTQELLSGRRSRTALVPIPVTLELPPGWGPDRRVGAHMGNLIVGYTPSGAEINIQLIPRPALRQDQLEHLVNGAKKEMAANPQRIPRVELRPLGTAQVLERQKIGEPAPLTIYDKNNQPHTSTESDFLWTLDVLIPHEGGVQDHQLSFLGLTKSQYDKDKDFLNSIMSTLQYVGAGEGMSATTTSSSAVTTTQPALNAPAAR